MRLKVQEESSSVGHKCTDPGELGALEPRQPQLLPWCLVAEKWCPWPVPSWFPSSPLPSSPPIFIP